MAALPDAELVYRLLVTGVAVVGPTLLFLGLWRVLQWLRDDELVEVLVARGVIDQPEPTPLDVMETVPGADRATRQCEHCGATNTAGVPVCRNCSRALN